MIISRLILGIIFLISGLFFIAFEFFSLYSTLMGIFLLSFGLYFLINQKEDEVEKIKKIKSTGGKK